MFINGFLAISTACGTGTCTEFSGAGYARQPITFMTPKNGVTYSARPYTFGQAIRGVFAGRAIFDAPTGGNLLFVMPNPQPPAAARPQWDSGDVAALRLVLTAMAAYNDGDAYTGSLSASSVVGTTNDCYDVVSLVNVPPGASNYAPIINTAPLSVGVGITVSRGILQAAGTGQA